MNSFLRQAFRLAAYPLHKIADAYDLAGFYVWRALMDDQFLAVSPAGFSSKPVRDGLIAYGWLRTRAQNAAVENLTVMGASGDVGPKPDIKPGLMRAGVRAGEYLLPQLARIQWNSPVVVGAFALTCAVAAYAMTHGTGTGHVAPDLVGTIYGSMPDGAKPKGP